MRKLNDHAAALADALGGIGGRWEKSEPIADAVSYLELCAGMQGVNFTTFPFDPLAGICGPPDEYREQHDTLRAALLHRLTMFLFSWSALETYLDEVDLPPPPKLPGRKTRKTDSLCLYLGSKLHGLEPAKYTEALTCFQNIVARSTIARRAAQGSDWPAFVPHAGKGIHLVYELRNAFAHGDFAVPSPDGSLPPEKHPDILLVAMATRMVFLTIQMVTLCHFSPEETVDMQSLVFRPRGRKALVLRDTFRTLHLSGFPDSIPSDDSTHSNSIPARSTSSS